MICDHHPIRRLGEMICRDCRYRLVFAIGGNHWEPPLSASERGRMGVAARESKKGETK